MDIPTKIRLATAYAKISEAELARRMGSTPQAFNQRMKSGKFSSSDLERIANAVGAEFVCGFRFPSGDEV